MNGVPKNRPFASGSIKNQQGDKTKSIRISAGGRLLYVALFGTPLLAR